MTVRTSDHVLALRDAIVAKIGACAKELRSCEAHEGTVDEAEVNRVYSAMPAAFVACLGFQDGAIEGGQVVCNARFSVFVLSGAPASKTRASQALSISEQVFKLAMRERWGLGGVKKSLNVRAENLYSGAVDKKAVALWAVTWTQRIALTEVDTDELPTFDTAQGQIQPDGVAPADGDFTTDDTIQLPQEEET